MAAQLASPRPDLALSVVFGTHNPDSCQLVMDDLVRLGLAAEIQSGPSGTTDSQRHLKLREDVKGKIHIAQLYGESGRPSVGLVLTCRNGRRIDRPCGLDIPATRQVGYTRRPQVHRLRQIERSHAFPRPTRDGEQELDEWREGSSGRTGENIQRALAQGEGWGSVAATSNWCRGWDAWKAARRLRGDLRDVIGACAKVALVSTWSVAPFQLCCAALHVGLGWGGMGWNGIGVVWCSGQTAQNDIINTRHKGWSGDEGLPPTDSL